MALIRYDIYNNFKDSSRIAYCTQGQNVGSLAFYNAEKDTVYILIPQDYYLSDRLIELSAVFSKEQFHDFELWEYLDEIEDVYILQEALNRAYYAYCHFYPNSEFLRNTIFKGFND